MIPRRMRLLAIGHNASLTGAPLLLESYLSQASRNNSFDQVRIVLGSGGALTQNYVQIADTFIVDRTTAIPWYNRMANKLNKVFGIDSSKKSLLCEWLEREHEPDIVYVNTVASIPILVQLNSLFKSKPKIVIHVHELDSLLQYYESEYNIGVFLRGASKVIAPCNAVAQALNALFRVPLKSIQIIPEWICRDIDVIRYSEMRTRVRRKLGLRENDMLCICVGTMQWRKGSDLLPLIVSACVAHDSGIHVAWIGSSTIFQLIELNIDVAKAGIKQFIHLIPEVDDPYPYFSAADLYMLPSREDPYPIAMLEAGLFQLPVVCFDQSGGAPEYVSNGSGISVPFLDIGQFASAVLEILKSPDKKEKMGIIARTAVLDKHNIADCEKLLTKTLASTLGTSS
jgi:glycosyltransferase involved in cell wall biosynthesis